MARLVFGCAAALWLSGLGLFLFLVTQVIRVTVIFRYAGEWLMFAVGPK